MRGRTTSIAAAAIMLAGLLLVWIVLAGELSPATVGVGLVIGVVIVFVVPWKPEKVRPLRLVWRALRFLLFLPYALAAVFVAGWKIAFLSVSLKTPLQSWVFACDYSLQERSAILLFAVLITLTPGTVVLDIAPERKRMYIHSLAPQREPPERQRRSIARLERQIGRIFA